MTEITAAVGPMPVPVGVVVLWLLAHRFIAHRFGDMRTSRRGERQWTTIVLVLEAFAMITVSITGGAGRWHPVLLPVFVVGNLLLVVATVVIRSSRRTIGRHFSVYLVTGEEHQLVRDGLYRRIRHPIYTGELLFHAGIPLLTCTWEALLFLPLFAGLLHLRMATEEQLLTRRHPGYSDYARESWRLLPGIY